MKIKNLDDSCELRVTTSSGDVITLDPGQKANIDAVKIHHGDRRAHYTVEPQTRPQS